MNVSAPPNKFSNTFWGLPGRFWWVILLPLGLFLLNLAWKLPLLAENPLGLDEPFSVYHAQMGVGGIVSELVKGNNPPLFEILLHFWIQLFGISEFSVRFLPVIFSSLVPVALFGLGIRHFSPRVGLISALLFTFSNYGMVFAHEARVYPLFMLLATLGVWVFLEWIQNATRKGLLFLWIFTHALLLYSHYLGVILVGLEVFLWVSLKGIRKNLRWGMVWALLGLVILMAPIAWVAIQRMAQAAGQGTWVKPVGMDAGYFMVARFSNAPVGAVMVLLLLAGAWGLVILRKASLATPERVVWAWFILPFFTLWLVSLPFFPRPVPLFLDRYLAFLFPGFLLSLGLALESLGRGWKGGRLLGILPVALFLATSKPNIPHQQPVREIVGRIQELKKDSSALVICPDWFDLTVVYHFRRDLFQVVDPKGSWMPFRSALAHERIYPVRRASQLDSAALSQSREILWLDGSANALIPNNKIEEKLGVWNDLARTEEIGKGFRLWVYQRRQPAH